MYKSKRIIYVTLLLLFFSGCMAKVPLAPPEIEANSKKFSPPGDRSLIYVYRIARGVGGGSLIQIQLNGNVIGSLANGTYLVVEVDPGEHDILSQYAIQMGDTIKILGDYQITTLYTLPGLIYFMSFELTGVGTYFPDNKFRLVSETEGKSYVKKYRMALPNAK